MGQGHCKRGVHFSSVLWFEHHKILVGLGIVCQVGGSPHPLLAISIVQSSRHRICGAPLQMARDNMGDFLQFDGTPLMAPTSPPLHLPLVSRTNH